MGMRPRDSNIRQSTYTPGLSRQLPILELHGARVLERFGAPCLTGDEYKLEAMASSHDHLG